MASKSRQLSVVILTDHARTRMSVRGIREWQVEQVLLYGRETHVRNSTIYAVGNKEIREYGKFLEACKGIHVLCSPDNEAVITTYRNHSLRRLKH